MYCCPRVSGIRNYKNSQKAINKMTISTYLSITTLNVNELNSPNKRHRLAKWIKKKKKDKTHLCVAYKRFTLDIRYTQSESEVMEKDFFMQMDTKESLNNYTYIRRK